LSVMSVHCIHTAEVSNFFVGPIARGDTLTISHFQCLWRLVLSASPLDSSTEAFPLFLFYEMITGTWTGVMFMDLPGGGVGHGGQSHP